MQWIKKGLIFKVDKNFEWMQSHSQVPTVDIVNDKIWRIYFSTRDSKNRSNISYFEVEAGNPTNIIYVHDKPILPLGKIGTFDDCGLMPSWIISHKGLKYLYYIGWTVRNTVPYHNSIGLAISYDNGKTFEKFSEGPIFSPTHKEPYFTGSSCVLIDNNIWKNWYLSCTKWEIINGKPEPFYHIKYAESKDGINWDRNGIVAIDYKSDEEAGIVKASVLKEGNKFKMWYSSRFAEEYRNDKEKSYRIGYAESYNGTNWTRIDDKVGIYMSETGWDSEMMAYPHVLDYNEQKYMFYNGNGFGKSGIGFAVLDKNL